MTSCCVTASTAATASGVGGAADRTGSTASSGTVPSAACASSTMVSTRHHNSYLWASLQTRPISGSVYRSITVLSSRATSSGWHSYLRHGRLLEGLLELGERGAQRPV